MNGSVAARDRVDVWCVDLREAEPDLESARALLSPGERVEAGRRRADAGDWMRARAVLRRLLARHLGLAPGEVVIERDPVGKPRLAPGAPADLRFGVSRRDGHALLALRLGHEVGADLERPRDDVDLAGVAALVLEGAAWAPTAGRDLASRRDAFFRAWVRHEALAKAAGAGIAAGPLPRHLAGRFTVRDLELPGFAAAVASEGRGWRMASGDAAIVRAAWRDQAPCALRAHRSFAGFARGLS